MNAVRLSLRATLLVLMAVLALTDTLTAQNSPNPYPSPYPSSRQRSAAMRNSSGIPENRENLARINNTFNKTFDLAKIGGLGREETLVMFDKIWKDFRRMYQLEADGRFTLSETSTTPDTLEAKAQFYAFIQAYPMDFRLVDMQADPVCGAKGTRYNYQSKAEEQCERCLGTGKLANVYNFKLIHTGELSAAVKKYLPNGPTATTPVVPAPTAGPRPEPKADPRISPELAASLKKVVEKHLSDLTNSKMSGPPATAFGISSAGFSVTNGLLNIDVQLQNKEAIKATGATLKVMFFETSAVDKPVVVAQTNSVAFNLDADNKYSIPVFLLNFPELKHVTNTKIMEQAPVEYSQVLKQIKRADVMVVQVVGITPLSAERVIDIDKESVWKIERSDQPGVGAGSSYGSGMVFTGEGHIFTNYHVIDKAKSYYVVVYENGQITKKLPATVVSKDQRADLVILQCKEWKAPAGSPPTPPPVVPSSQCKLGATVFVLGYPLPGALSSNVKYTNGVVSDMAGLDDDSSKIQHTAQIQPGNSGGPMALADGRVVGVIVSSLNAAYALKTTGALPQGINFSIKSDYLLTQASIAGIEIPKYTAGPEPVEHVKAYTVQIMCEK